MERCWPLLERISERAKQRLPSGICPLARRGAAPAELDGTPFPCLWAAAWAPLARAQGAALLRQGPPQVLAEGLAEQPLLRLPGGAHLFPWALGPCRRQVV